MERIVGAMKYILTQANLLLITQQVCRELLEARSTRGDAILHSIIRVCNEEFANVGVTAAAAGARRAAFGGGSGANDGAVGDDLSLEASGGLGWLRGAVEVLGQLVPAVAAYQGFKVVLQWCINLVTPDWCHSVDLLHVQNCHVLPAYDGTPCMCLHRAMILHKIKLQGWCLVGNVE